MKTILLCVALVTLSTAGCATKPGVLREREWNRFIGNYSYSQAIAELGRPHVTGERSDGSQFAEWIMRRSPQVSFGLGVGTGSYGRHSSVGVGAGTTVTPPPSGEYLHLNFDTNGMLKAWTKIRH